MTIMDNKTVLYLSELDTALKSLSVLRNRIESSLKVPVLDQVCVHTQLRQKNKELALPFDNNIPYLDVFAPATISIVGLTTYGITGSFTLSAIFSAISYAGLELRRRWVSERIESIMYRKQTKHHLHNVANHVKFLDALGVQYNSKTVKQLLYRALKSEQHLTGPETILLITELWNAFVSNDDLSKLRESAFDSIYVPDEFVAPIYEDDDDEYLDLLFEEDDEFESVKDDADKMEARFEELFGGFNENSEPSSIIDNCRLVQEVNQANEEVISDAQMMSALTQIKEGKAEGTNDLPSEPTQLEDPFGDEDFTFDLEDTPPKSDNEQDESLPEPLDEGPSNDILNSSLDELLSADTKEESPVEEPANEPSIEDTPEEPNLDLGEPMSDDAGAQESSQANTESSDVKEDHLEDDEPFSLTSSDANSLFDTLDSSSSMDDIPDMDIPDTHQDDGEVDEDEDDDGDLESLIFALEDQAKDPS